MRIRSVWRGRICLISSRNLQRELETRQPPSLLLACQHADFPQKHRLIERDWSHAPPLPSEQMSAKTKCHKRQVKAFKNIKCQRICELTQDLQKSRTPPRKHVFRSKSEKFQRPGHFWKLRCSKKCARLWREAGSRKKARKN